MSATKKILFSSILGVFLVFIVSVGGFSYLTFNKVNETFRLNAQLKKEGYYLSEFEFELLGAAYSLDHGQYLKGLAGLDRIHEKMKTGQGLVKIPDFSGPEEKLDFYLDLQNPKTGAFYSNDSDHPFAYIGVTANMIEFIEDLSKQADRPFHLKYPLRFLDQINTPEKLNPFLDDVSRVGWIGAKFKPPFVCIIELRDLIEQGDRLGTYSFSSEFKHAFLQWFYDNQHPDTGLWGPRDLNSGELIDGGDVGDSGKVIKMFVDRQGNDIHPEFPLRYVNKIFASSLEKLTAPMPNDMDELHRWILDKDRGFRFLTRYLWQKASVDDKEAARKLIEDFIRIRFDKYYVAKEGAFSLYPDTGHADLDGTGEAIGMYGYIGALSTEEQMRLWGESAETIVDLGRHRVSEIGETEIGQVSNHPEVNSVRLYGADPEDDFLGNVEAVLYPGDSKVLDLADLLPRLEEWLATTPQNMGNWVTKDRIFHRLASIDIRPVPVFRENLVKHANEIYRNNSELVLIGLDELQVPRVRIVYERAGNV
jgi:hypothetical protein